ncbi:MAG: response regulator transcription factor [Chloroflexota bacterium]
MQWLRSAKILVIEDDEFVARTIERSLRSSEFVVSLANSGERGLRMARQDRPDLVILDVIMPDINGYAVCRAMRSDPSLADMPILFLTARVKTEDRIAGFVAGGDDYLCKPFNVDELILRVRAILHRTQDVVSDTEAAQPSSAAPDVPQPGQPSAADRPHCLVVGKYILDTLSFELHTPQRGSIRLTPLQYDLLYHLMTHPGQAFSPARLLDEVWDYPNGRGSPDLVRVHIKTLRERIEANPRSPTFIKTLPGRGYAVLPGTGGL